MVFNNTRTWFQMGYFGTWMLNSSFVLNFYSNLKKRFSKTIKVIRIYFLKTKTSIVEEKESRHYRFMLIVNGQPTILTKQEWVIIYASWLFPGYICLDLLQIHFRCARDIVIKFQCAFQIVKNWNFTGRNDNIMLLRVLFERHQSHIVFQMLPIKINLFA